MPVSSRSRTFSSLLALIALFALTAPLRGLADARVDVIISFHSRPGPADQALVRGAGGGITHTFHLVPAIAASLPAQAIAALERNPRIAAIEPDGRVFAVDAELDNSWGVKRIGAAVAHAGGLRGAGVKVAIIDSGIDYTHPDLVSNYAGGYDFVNNDADPSDDNKHGTHVAGIIAGLDNDLGVIGVAPEAAIYALKVLGADGSGSFSNMIAALQWAVDNHIQITNNSYGSAQSPGFAVQTAFDNAAAGGMLHIAAAGNSGTCAGTGDNVLYPARYASVIAVAATDSADVSPCFSSTGPKVELAAPGAAVNSTIPGGGYEVLSGTSMASPHVAGTAALVMSTVVADTNGNGRINDEVRQILISTAHDLGNPGRDTWYGYGLVDAAAAVQPPAPPQPGVAVTVGTDKVSYTSGVDTAVRLTTTVKDENGAVVVGLSGAAFVTALDGVVRPVNFVETATPGTYSGMMSLTGVAVGSHTVVATATDTRGLLGSGSASFNVTVANTVRVKAITYSTFGGFTGKAHLVISVAIVNGAGAPVSGATVSVMLTRNGGFYGATNGLSNSSGNAVFEARNAPSGCYQMVVFAVISGTKVWDGTTPPNMFCK
jgi:subtilisin